MVRAARRCLRVLLLALVAGGVALFVGQPGLVPHSARAVVPAYKKTLIIAKAIPNPHYGTSYSGTPFQVTLQGWPDTSLGTLTITEEQSAVVEAFASAPFTVTIKETIPDSAAEYIYYGWKPGTWLGYSGPTSTPLVVCPGFDPATEYNPVDPVVSFEQQAEEVVVVCVYNGLPAKLTKSVSSQTVRPGETFFWELDLWVYRQLETFIMFWDRFPLWENFLSLQGGFIYGPPVFSPSPASFECTVQPPVPLLSCSLPKDTPPGRYSVRIPVTVPTDTFEVCGRFVNRAEWMTIVPVGNPPSDVKFLKQVSNEAAVEVVCGGEGVVAESGTLYVAKVVRGQPGDATQFTANISGPGITGTASLPFSQQTPAAFLGLAAGTFTISETPRNGYTYAGWAYGAIVGESVQCPANPTSTAANATATLTNVSPQAAICFYNDPRVTIRVQKTLSVIGFTSPGAGWQFTLTGCGITPQQGTTNQQGVVEFTDLPPAIGCSYTVTETVQSGWTPQFISQTAQPTQGGQVVTLTFLNIRDFNPPCVDPNDPRCVPPPPTVTPTPPTATPTTTPTSTPTNTPTPTATPTNTPTPTPTDTPVTQVAGERTPGPGQSPTPLAPATGFGFGQGEGGMSLLLVLAGLVSLSLGLGFLALGRRTNR